MGKGEGGVSADPGFGQVGHDRRRSESVRRKSGWLGTLLLAGDGGRPVNSQVIKVIGTKLTGSCYLHLYDGLRDQGCHRSVFPKRTPSPTYSLKGETLGQPGVPVL